MNILLVVLFNCQNERQPQLNPLDPNIRMHILHTVLHINPKVLTKRISESFFSWSSFYLFSCTLSLIQG